MKCNETCQNVYKFIGLVQENMHNRSKICQNVQLNKIYQNARNVKNAQNDEDVPKWKKCTKVPYH